MPSRPLCHRYSTYTNWRIPKGCYGGCNTPPFKLNVTKQGKNKRKERRKRDSYITLYIFVWLLRSYIYIVNKQELFPKFSSQPRSLPSLNKFWIRGLIRACRCQMIIGLDETQYFIDLSSTITKTHQLYSLLFAADLTREDRAYGASLTPYTAIYRFQGDTFFPQASSHKHMWPRLPLSFGNHKWFFWYRPCYRRNRHPPLSAIFSRPYALALSLTHLKEIKYT